MAKWWNNLLKMSVVLKQIWQTSSNDTCKKGITWRTLTVSSVLSLEQNNDRGDNRGLQRSSFTSLSHQWTVKVSFIRKNKRKKPALLKIENVDILHWFFISQGILSLLSGWHISPVILREALVRPCENKWKKNNKYIALMYFP